MFHLEICMILAWKKEPARRTEMRWVQEWSILVSWSESAVETNANVLQTCSRPTADEQCTPLKTHFMPFKAYLATRKANKCAEFSKRHCQTSRQKQNLWTSNIAMGSTNLPQKAQKSTCHLKEIFHQNIYFANLIFWVYMGWVIRYLAVFCCICLNLLYSKSAFPSLKAYFSKNPLPPLLPPLTFSSCLLHTCSTSRQMIPRIKIHW